MQAFLISASLSLLTISLEKNKQTDWTVTRANGRT